MASRSAVPVAQDVETLPVFVVKEDIPMGSMLVAENLKLEQWPKDKVPEGVLGKLEDIEGRRPCSKLYEGEPILDMKLLAKGESGGGAAPTIPVGYRVVPVKVDDVSGGAAMILPGDRIDLLVYVKGGKEIRTTQTKTILQNIKIFAVDSTWTLESDESGKSIRAKTISLLLTPEQTERVMLAGELGKLRLALRSPSDQEEAELPDEGHQVAQLFGNAEMADTEKDSVLTSLMNTRPEPQPVPVELSAPEQPSHTVRVISGSDVHEVVMQSAAEEIEVETSGGTAPKSGSASSFLWKIISKPAKTDNQGASTQGLAPPADLDPIPAPQLGPGGSTEPEMPAGPADTRDVEIDN